MSFWGNELEMVQSGALGGKLLQTIEDKVMTAVL